jgi:hypothetical protein
MFLQFLMCFLINHLGWPVDVSLAMIQMNAAILAVGLFVFIGLRLRVDARERERRIATALLIW